MPHVDHFLAAPLAHPPARRPGARRRTSSVDMVTQSDGDLLLIGLAQDPDGATARCAARLSPAQVLRSLELEPGLPGSGSLNGLVVRRGFRAAVDALCPPGTLTSVLLCELPVATLLSGYGSLVTGQFRAPLSEQFIEGLPVDICAGWISAGTMMVSVRRDKTMPAPTGPLAPLDDPADWHQMAPLAPGSMRRQRLIERDGDAVWAMFRDSYTRTDGVVTVLHEYSLEATLEREGHGSSRVVTCVATPRVLPWRECPSAAASAARVCGHPVQTLRALVKDDLVGTSTCTHLNDLLTSLAQADALV